MKQDVVAVISAHHAVLDWLTERVTEAGRSPVRRVLFNEFVNALGGHLRAIDEAVIPALRAVGWRNVSSGLLVGHVDIKHRLGELLTLRLSTRAHELALAALAANLESQQAREVRHLLPVLQDALDDWQREQLGGEVQDHLSRATGDRPSGFADSQPAASLLEEAKLVLGSFPALQ